MEDIGKKIGSVLKARRIEAKLSQSAAAQALGTPLRTYQAWEKTFTSSIQNLVKIASFFDIPLDQLIPHSLKQQEPEEYRYKRRIFRMAMEGADSRELYDWLLRMHPESIEGNRSPEQCIENCLLDIYHHSGDILSEYQFQRNREKEGAIGDRFRLPKDQIYVISSGSIEHELLREMIIAPFGAELLCSWAQEKPGMRIGISNGFTIARILDSIRRGAVSNIKLFPLNFTGTQVDLPISSTSLISSFLYRCTGYGVESDTVSEEQVFSSMLLADAAFLGIGNFSREGLYERMIRSVLGQRYIDDIRSRGVVGDLNYHLFDSDGNEVNIPEIAANIGDFDRQALVKSIGLKTLTERAERGTKLVIAGTGTHKAESIRIALDQGYANHLICDESVADAMLKA